jgi:hypothetical protein
VFFESSYNWICIISYEHVCEGSSFLLYEAYLLEGFGMVLRGGSGANIFGGTTSIVA